MRRLITKQEYDNYGEVSGSHFVMDHNIEKGTYICVITEPYSNITVSYSFIFVVNGDTFHQGPVIQAYGDASYFSVYSGAHNGWLSMVDEDNNDYEGLKSGSTITMSRIA